MTETRRAHADPDAHGDARPGSIWRSYGLSLALGALFMACWVLQTLTGWQEFVAEQAEHGLTPSVFGADGYVWSWSRTTFENWQSEFLQLFAFVMLSAWLIHRGSPQSKDGDDEMRAQLARIEARLARLDGLGGAASAPVVAGMAGAAGARADGRDAQQPVPTHPHPAAVPAEAGGAHRANGHARGQVGLGRAA